MDNKRDARRRARQATARRHERERAARAVRRQLANAAATPIESDGDRSGGIGPVRRRGPRRLVMAGVPAVVALVAIIAVVAVISDDGDSKQAAPSTELTAVPVAGADGPLELSAPPMAYAVTYELQGVEDDVPAPLDVPDTVAPTATDPISADDYLRSTESFRVRRPFDTHISSVSGDATEPDWSITSTFGVSASSNATPAPTIETIVPTAGIGDWRLDAVLADLVADGSFVLRDRRSLLGRECQVYRTGSPLENYEVTVPTDATYADVCIDGAGLLLEQVAVRSGRLVEHLTATSIDAAASFTDDDFAITGEPIAVGEGGKLLAAIGGPPSDQSYWGMPTPPEGYTLRGHYTLTESATDADSVSTTGDSTGVSPSTVVISYVDVYVSGPNAIVVRQGPTSVRPDDGSAGTVTATSGALGDVSLDSRLTGSLLLATPAATPNWYVQLTGTIPRAALLAVADTLLPPPG